MEGEMTEQFTSHNLSDKNQLFFHS